MNPQEGILKVQAELEQGIALPKCQQCGCMESTLKSLAAVLPTQGTDGTAALVERVSAFLQKMCPVQYACLGCKHCFPAAAQNALSLAFPTLSTDVVGLDCELRVREEVWPPVVGEYFVLDPSGPVAISTLASVQLAEEVVRRKPNGLAIVGKTETENIGIDKVIKNIVSSPMLRYLIVTGADPRGHLPGQTLLALSRNGVDEQRRVIGSKGKRPILRNVSNDEIRAFREQVQIVNMIGCDRADEISAQVEEYARRAPASCGCSECSEKSSIVVSTPTKLTAAEPSEAVRMDRAGYFVIVPLSDKEVINVEHYDYDNSLIRTVEGATARAIYRTIIDQGWVTELSHAAYLGKELAKAELSLRYGFRYCQDGA